MWCGPAPIDPPRRNSKKNGSIHYDWHWFWEYGNGDLGNQGIHQMDIARWALGEPEISPRVISIGGRLGYEDDGITPNTQIVFHDYKAAPLIFEVRGLPAGSDSTKMDEYRGASIGVVIDCEGGSIVIPSYTKAIVYDKDGKEIKTYEEGGDHFANFIQAVRSRKRADLHADIAEGHISAALCSYRQYFLSPRQTDCRRKPFVTRPKQTVTWPKVWAGWKNISARTRWTCIRRR